jgi:hypothetical protein
MMIWETFDRMMWPLTRPELAPSPIRVVLLLRRMAPRADWSAVLVYGFPSVMSTVPASLMILGVVPPLAIAASSWARLVTV